MKLSIGKIVNTHGIRGELKVYPTTDFVDERFCAGNHVYIEYGKELVDFEIESVRFHKGCILVTFVGFHNINDVEKYKGLELFVEVDGSEDDDYYYYELIGCEVYYQDKLIGVVNEILETEAHDILRIQRDGLDDVLIPYVDRFILNVDVDEKRIDVDVIEGML
ncbi:MAG: ribosome maturation factor RimM [Traorella sp.]